MNNGPSLGEYTDHIDVQRDLWCREKRSLVVQFATGEVGSQQKGSPQVDSYWRETCPFLSDAQVHQASNKHEWCGVFALWCLRQAGVTKLAWAFGYGFIGPAKLKRTSSPKPGDIAYTNEPYQHHAIVVSCEDGQLVTIDGNQRNGVVRKSRPMPDNIVFFSIESMLLEALDS